MTELDLVGLLGLDPLLIESSPSAFFFAILETALPVQLAIGVPDLPWADLFAGFDFTLLFLFAVQPYEAL